jgi:hypothetical protein
VTKSRIAVLIAVICLFLWVYLAYVRNVASGWIHLALIAGVVAIAYAMIEADGDPAPS